jgi:hypothetical protein
MQYKKRKTNGQFRSKKQSERLFTAHFSIVVALLVSPVALGLALTEDHITFERPQVQKAQAEEVQGPIEVIEILPEKVEQAIADIPHESKVTTDVIKHIYTRAAEVGLDGDALAHTIFCESQFYNIQSGIVVDGVQEPSYGIAQIHLPSHKDVSYEEAMDPYFAVDFVIEHWAEGTKGIWHGYNRATDSCNNTINEYWK